MEGDTGHKVFQTKFGKFAAVTTAQQNRNVNMILSSTSQYVLLKRVLIALAVGMGEVCNLVSHVIYNQYYLY